MAEIKKLPNKPNETEQPSQPAQPNQGEIIAALYQQNQQLKSMQYINSLKDEGAFRVELIQAIAAISQELAQLHATVKKMGESSEEENK